MAKRKPRPAKRRARPAARKRRPGTEQLSPGLAQRLKALSASPRARRLPRVPETRQLEEQYLRSLMPMLRVAFRLVRSLVDVRELTGDDGLRTDASTEGFVRLFRSRMVEIRARFAKEVPVSLWRKAVQKAGRLVGVFTKKATASSVQQVLGIDILSELSDTAPASFVELWTALNVDLIVTVPERFFSSIEKAVIEHVRTGKRASSLVNRLGELEASSGWNAQRIARDQIGKLTSQLHRARQQELGVTHYIWSTSKDERVRGDPSGAYPDADPSHFEREGDRFSWEHPPEDGAPGEPILCRCVALPDFTTIAP